MDMITTSVLIGSSSNLQVTRTGVNDSTCSNSDHICPFTLELPTLSKSICFLTCLLPFESGGSHVMRLLFDFVEPFLGSYNLASTPYISFVLPASVSAQLEKRKLVALLVVNFTVSQFLKVCRGIINS